MLNNLTTKMTFSSQPGPMVRRVFWPISEYHHFFCVQCAKRVLLFGVGFNDVSLMGDGCCAFPSLLLSMLFCQWSFLSCYHCLSHQLKWVDPTSSLLHQSTLSSNNKKKQREENSFFGHTTSSLFIAYLESQCSPNCDI